MTTRVVIRNEGPNPIQIEVCEEGKTDSGYRVNVSSIAVLPAGKEDAFLYAYPQRYFRVREVAT